ncbi:MAG: SPOR domain-containing protein [Deltaproteobacteria bacterium]|nr:SPOR domain-containing protein [Deltaproteobacteria bacterium]
MFDKLFSFKKKPKKKAGGESSLDDEIFSASGSEGGDEDFFSEPSFGAEGVEGAEGPPSVPGDISLTDSSEDDISAPDRFGESSDVFSEDDLLKSSKVVKRGSGRRTFLLFILFLLFGGYAAYTYILPQYYPDLLAELTQIISEVSIEKVSTKKEAPKRVAVKKAVPPKPAPPKPTPAKPSEEAAKAGAPVKPDEKAVPVAKARQEAKAVVAKAVPAGKKPEAVPLDDALEPVEKEAKKPKQKEAARPVPAKVKAPPVKPAEPVKKEEPAVKAPPVPRKEVTAPPKPAPKPKAKPKPPKPVVRPSKKAGKDIKIARGTVPVSAKGYYLQAGVYIFKGNLKAPRKKIESLGYTPLVKQGRKVIKMNRLLVGTWGDFLIAEDLVLKLRKSGFSAELISKNERFAALIGSFYYKHMADKKKNLLRKKGFAARIEKTPINMKVHHLLVGPYKTPEEADTVLDSLKRKGLKAVIIQKR